jgi:hypothetical protein
MRQRIDNAYALSHTSPTPPPNSLGSAKRERRLNLHAPERQAGESQDDYRARRELSQQIAAACMAPTNPPRFVQRVGKVGQSRRDKHRSEVAISARIASLATEPKPLTIRARKPKAEIKPTWPRTPNQKRQQRPLIVLGKNRERDAGKRTKPKSAVAKRMDRPHRVAQIDRGHAKLMHFFGTV